MSEKLEKLQQTSRPGNKETGFLRKFCGTIQKSGHKVLILGQEGDLKRTHKWQECRSKQRSNVLQRSVAPEQYGNHTVGQLANTWQRLFGGIVT